LPDAASFLSRRYCLSADGAVTVLGLLVFGQDPSQFLENRARLDCYFETGSQIGRDKKYLDNDILNLMDDAFAFVWGHIQVGRSALGGGRSEPEYPTELIRETINNALAHRDYTANQFVTIKVNPGKNIEIKNPGGFKQKMLLTDLTGPIAILRIIPGLPESRNPKLANVLKALEKIERQGIGMATLVSACLDNLTDLPYYDLSVPGSISLVIPSGRLLDEPTQRWINSFRGYLSDRLNRALTLADESVLAYLYKAELLNQRRLYTILLGPSNNHFEALAALQQAGLILEHPSASAGPSPVYVVARELTLVDFTPQIEAQTQLSLASLDHIAKIVLNIVYRYDHYNRQAIKPNLITPELYFRLYGKEITPHYL
jgi:ATP-dependent DNA helicase RecG